MATGPPAMGGRAPRPLPESSAKDQRPMNKSRASRERRPTRNPSTLSSPAGRGDGIGRQRGIQLLNAARNRRSSIPGCPSKANAAQRSGALWPVSKECLRSASTAEAYPRLPAANPPTSTRSSWNRSSDAHALRNSASAPTRLRGGYSAKLENLLMRSPVQILPTRAAPWPAPARTIRRAGGPDKSERRRPA